jgi:hypothetical protein
MIEPGWRVEANDGTEVGRVKEVTGDSNADIFDGLSVGSKYVPAEQVAAITEGVVRLSIDASAFGGEQKFEEPAAEIEISSEKASLTQRLLDRFKR